jgi:hypothetical protein
MNTETGSINLTSNSQREEELLTRLNSLETQVNDFVVMLGQHNKQIHRMSIIISDLLKKLESTGDKNL